MTTTPSSSEIFAGFDPDRDRSQPDEDSRHVACPLLSIVVPVFNEEETLELFLSRTRSALAAEDVEVEFVFVDDGSSDDTLKRLLAIQLHDPAVRVVELSRNFGKEAALTAGLASARGAAVVPMDVDLQDPPELIPKMLARWREGFDAVLGRRTNRSSDSAAKRLTARWFYRVHNLLSEPPLPENVGDFRLMDRSVVDALNALPESRRFMKGLFAWAGFKTSFLDYERPARSAGQTKFNGWRLWNFALEGITSFSTAPLRVWSYLGFLVSTLSFAYGTYIIVRALIFGIDVPGYASLFAAVAFLGGLQLLGIGIVGEYLGRTYMEAKRRPVCLVRRIYEPKSEVSGRQGT